MNRNILVEDDFPELVLESGSDSPTRPTPDSYFERLLKYIPVEIIGSYLIVAGLLESAYARGSAHRVSLGIAFAVGVVLAPVYAARVLHVRRTMQLLMTAAAFAVWVFATGHFFATFSWWHPWTGTIGVVVFGVLVRVVDLGPLPPEPGPPASDSPPKVEQGELTQ